MKSIALITALALSGCVYSQPKVFRNQTAGDYYSTLGSNKDKEIFNKGYDYAQTDASGNLYAAQHNIDQYAINHVSSGQKKEISLHRKILQVPVPGYQDSEGQHDPSIKYIELPEVE